MKKMYLLVILLFSLTLQAASNEFFDSAFLTQDCRDNLYIYFKNPTEKPLIIKEVYINGKNLKDLAEKGKKLKKQVEIKKGIVKWYDIVPNPVFPGEWAVLKVRFGARDEVKEKVKVKLITEKGDILEKEIKVIFKVPIEFNYYSFDKGLKKFLFYLSGEKNVKIEKVLINGKEVFPEIRKIERKARNYFILSYSFSHPLLQGKYKVLKVITNKGTVLTSFRVIKPYFPVGMVVGPKLEEEFKDCKEHLINSFYYGGLPSSTSRYGSKPFPYEYYRKYNFRLLDDAWWQKDLIEEYKLDPIILAWSIADEPECHNCSPMGLVEGINKYYKKHDMINPISHVYCIWPGYPAQEYNFVDIVLQDVYPIPGAHPIVIEESMEECWRASRPKPVWFVGQSFGWTRLPTPDELRLMVYEAIAYHAKGIFYFMYGHKSEPCYGVGIRMETLKELYPNLKKEIEKQGRDVHTLKVDAAKLWESMRWLNLELNLIGNLVNKSAVIPISESSNNKVEVTSIVSEDTIILICLNHNYKYRKKEGSIFHPVRDTKIEVNIPNWFKVKDLFEIYKGEIKRISYKNLKNKVIFTIPELKVAKVYILTGREELFASMKENLFFLLKPIYKTKRSIKIDGKFSDWEGIEPIVIDPNYASPKYYYLKDFKESEDLSIKVYLTWDDKNFYIGAKIRDDIHHQEFTGGSIWLGDLFQIAFDPKNNGGRRFKKDDIEFGFALTKQGVQCYCWHNPDKNKTGLRKDIPLKIKRKSPYTFYEIAIPLKELNIEKNQTFGFNFVVGDTDKDPFFVEGEIDWLQLSPGIVGGKLPSYFKKFILTDIKKKDF